MIEIAIKVGDLLDEAADAIVCPANPWLNMSGGVNGEILLRGGASIQEELHTHLRTIGKAAVEPGTVVVTSAGELRAKYLLHAIAIDPFYDSSVELVCKATSTALAMARRLGTSTLAMPALATGYGRLAIEDFGAGLWEAIQGDWFPTQQLIVVVRKTEYADTLLRLLQNKRPEG